ncbi:hypothetical protein QN277_022712 [Acacia crassicarpa]|uniref:Uncharacterized protein n=1 Tax=Acacia crassicarpa TaxID=499986 RepID=A0AAE1MPZ2_9FABA|nr:hypothetical protein QN277_022712 [Acacia crassicarpa]
MGVDDDKDLVESVAAEDTDTKIENREWR